MQMFPTRRLFLKGVVKALVTGIAMRGANRQQPGEKVSLAKRHVQIDPGDDLLYFHAGDCPFEPMVLELLGAGENGSLLAGFDEQSICHVIQKKLGLAISPDLIFGFENITGCGLFPLWVIEHDRARRFRFWVLMTE